MPQISDYATLHPGYLIANGRTKLEKHRRRCYALFSGLAFIAIMVVMLSPLIHRLFRTIHMETGRDRDN